MLTLADFKAPFYGLSRRAGSAGPLRVPVVVVGMNLRNRPGTPLLDGVKLRRLVFGPGPSVAEWFAEMSQGRFLLEPHPTAPVVGPFTSRFDWQFYYREGPWLPASLPVGDPHRWVDATGEYGPVGSLRYLDDDGYIGGHSHSWGEMMRAADADPRVALGSYDRDRDGLLDPTECVFLLVKNQVRASGTRRPVSASQVPLPAQPLVLDGVRVDLISELYTSPPHDQTDLSVCGEELLHLAAGLVDQYPDTGAVPSYRAASDPGRPGQFSISDAIVGPEHRPVHVDPYHKLKWGWLNPQLARTSGTYALRPAATTGDALILANPHVGAREFFIVENRWRGTSYDRFRDPACGDGLAVWHCIQDVGLTTDWGRRAVHLRRADPALGANGTPQDRLALFDGSAPGRGYDLHDDSTPTNLRFRDGSPSRLAIRNVPAAAETMTLHVTVPPERGRMASAVGRVSRLRVHERSTGYGPPGERLPQDCVVSVDTEPGGTFGIDIARGPDGRWMFQLVREALGNGEPVRLEYRSDTSYGGEVLRVLRT